MKFLFVVPVSFIGLALAPLGCGGGGGSTSSVPATPTITWPAAPAITYGTAIGATQLDASANYPGSFTYSPSSGTILTAGVQTLTATFTPSDPKQASSATATNLIRVNPAIPTIAWTTPAAVTVDTSLGASQLDATATVGGVSLPGAFIYSPTAGTVLSAAGTQTLAVTFEPADSIDYSIVSSSVTLSVIKATPSITWAAPAAVPVGTALSAAQLNATASIGGTPVPGTFSYSPAAGTTMSSAGNQTLSVTFTPTDVADYNSSTASVELTVTKGTPTITWDAPSPVLVGTVLSGTQLDAAVTYGGKILPGTIVYTPASGTMLNSPGTQSLSATFTPNDGADYTTANDSVNLTVNALPVQPTYSWTNVRIVGGGYVTGTYFHPTEPNLVYVRTDVGGLYRRGPNDSQWVPLLDFEPMANANYTGVEAIGLDPTNPNNLYVAVGLYDASYGTDGAMLVSTDQGATFKTVPFNFKNGSNEPGRNTGERIAVDPNLPSTVYYGSPVAGLQLSTDSGSTWNQMTGLQVNTSISSSIGPISNGVVSVLPIGSSGTSGNATPVVYAVTGGTGIAPYSQGIYVTTNGGSIGSTWTAVAGQPNFTAAATPLAPLEARLGSDGLSIYILYGDQAGPDTMNTSQLWKFIPDTTWKNGSWKQITLPNQNLNINISNGYGGIGVDPSVPGHLLLGTLDQYYPTGDVVYASSDDGATWRDVSSYKTPGNSPLSLSPDLSTHDNTIAPYVGAPGNVSTGNWPTSLSIDPFNSAHAFYVYGGGVWATNDLTNANPSATSVGIVDWTFDDLGIEETVVENLWAPPSGPTLLLSAIGDVSGFAHQSLTASPAQGNFTNPSATPTSIDYEASQPANVVRVTDGSNGASPILSISADGGLTWTGSPSTPTGTKGGGMIAIAADGSSLVWATEDTDSVWYSKDGGNTWKASNGASAQSQVVSDRVNPSVFYALSNGTLSISDDGGANFYVLQTLLPSTGVISALPDAQGDLLIFGGAYLYTNTGTTKSPIMTPLPGIQEAYHVGFGKAASGSSSPTLYMDGTIAGVWGLYRSVDGGYTWVQINDAAHQWGGINAVCGDMRTFGTVYLGSGEARGIIWGTSPN